MAQSKRSIRIVGKHRKTVDIDLLVRAIVALAEAEATEPDAGDAPEERRSA